MTETLYSLWCAQAAPSDKAVLVCADGPDYSGTALAEATGRFANVLTALGVRPGDRVAVQVEKSAEVVVLLLACMRAGAIFVPLNTSYTATEVEYFLRDGEPTLFVCPPERVEDNRRMLDGMPGVRLATLGRSGEGTLARAAASAAVAFVDAAPGSDDVAAILYTSGTTGRSKGAMLTHRNLVSNVRGLAEAWRFTAGDVLLHTLPLFHLHGLFLGVGVPLVSGATCLLLPRFDPDLVFEHLGAATAFFGVPTLFTRLLDDSRLTREAVAHMRLFVSGSAPLLGETHDRFRERTGHRILERYGMTETLILTSNPYEGERRAGSVGSALPGVELRIVDPGTGRVLGAGEIGGIEVRGPNVFAGYWRQEEKTRSEFRDGFFMTGDVGCIDADGYVRIVGRSKDLIISGGYNVYPKEVEDAIHCLDWVAEAAVIGVPHDDFGEAVVAVVVPKAGRPPSEPELMAALKTELARYKHPKHVHFVADLPRNAMGKIQKNVLRERYAKSFEPADEQGAGPA